MQTLSVRIPDELKRLPSALKRALDAEIRKIAGDPLRGDRKRAMSKHNRADFRLLEHLACPLGFLP